MSGSESTAPLLPGGAVLHEDSPRLVKWMKAGTWGSLIASVLTIAFGIAIRALKGISWKDGLHVDMAILNLVKVSTIFCAIAIVIAIVHLRWPAATQNSLFTLGLLVFDGLTVGFLLFHSIVALVWFNSLTFCNTAPWRQPRPTPEELELCNRWRVPIGILSGFLIAFVLDFVICHLGLFIVRFLHAMKSIYTKDNNSATFRLGVGSLAFEASFSISRRADEGRLRI